MRRGDVFMSGYVAVVCAAMGLVFWLVLAPQGVAYVSAPYHFTLRYPSNWQVSIISGDVPGGWVTPSATSATSASSGAGNAPSSPTPLVLTITRVGQHAGTVPISSVTVTIWDLSNPTAATQAASLRKNRAMHATTIAGLAGLAAAPTHLPLPGVGGSVSGVTDTHIDYFLVHGAYEYELSTDSISGDNADSALQGIVASFRLSA